MAIAIGRTLVQLMPDEPGTYGLMALKLHCETRGQRVIPMAASLIVWRFIISSSRSISKADAMLTALTSKLVCGVETERFGRRQGF